MFELDPKLKQSSYPVGRFELCQMLLSKDCRFPWFILVPMRPQLREIYQLSEADRAQLMAESCLVSQTLQDLYQPTKLNVAVLGNVVAQLHMHHIARFSNDAAWPGPVWGLSGAREYTEDEARREVEQMHRAVQGRLSWQRA